MKYIITIEADIDPEEMIGLKEQIGALSDVKVVNVEEKRIPKEMKQTDIFGRYAQPLRNSVNERAQK